MIRPQFRFSICGKYARASLTPLMTIDLENAEPVSIGYVAKCLALVNSPDC